jgi:hypothetical protein
MLQHSPLFSYFLYLSRTEKWPAYVLVVMTCKMFSLISLGKEENITGCQVWRIRCMFMSYQSNDEFYWSAFYFFKAISIILRWDRTTTVPQVLKTFMTLVNRLTMHGRCTFLVAKISLLYLRTGIKQCNQLK